MSTTAQCVICGLTFESRTSYGLCPLCWSKDRLREWDRVQSATRSALRANRPATLTLVQWLSTVSDFEGLCAYCQEMTYSYIDMVNPALGLIYENVVPLCRACAVHRRSSFEDAKIRVLKYLLGQGPVRYPIDQPRATFSALFDQEEEVMAGD